ncbi:MAG: hypothetical protein GF346_08355 [Candidatus Eisenbacteria bacterium]|nr:hypothetical protein [Candidatus Latescibacterota bacterium]MBD3302445.1 hypothetical protein [Candidatus Eisenbacteria bacterium]
MKEDLPDRVAMPERPGGSRARRDFGQQTLQRRSMPGLSIERARDLVPDSIDLRHGILLVRGGRRLLQSAWWKPTSGGNDMRRNLGFYAWIIVLLIFVLPASASDREAKTVLDHQPDGAMEVRTAGAAPNGPTEENPAGAAATREGELLWQNTYEDAIYQTTSIAGGVEKIFAGTYLNVPRQAELVPIEGDGTPDWTYDGTQVYTAASRDGSVLASVDYESSPLEVTVRAWDPSSDVPLWSQVISPASPGSYRTIAVSADGSTIAVLVSMQAGSPEARLYLFDPADGSDLGIYDGPAGFARNLSITDDGRFIAFIGLSTAYVVDRDAGTIRWFGSMGATNDPIAISANGQYLAYGWSSLTVREWDGSAYAPLWSQGGSGFYLKSVAFSGDGDTFATGWYKSTFTQNRFQLFDMPSSTPLWTFLTQEASGDYQEIPSDLVLTPDGSHLLAGSWGDQNNLNPEIHLFSRESAVPLFTVDTPGSVFDVDLVADGPCDLYLTACGKRVHSNEQGRGGHLFSAHYGCPAGIDEAPATASAVRFSVLPNPLHPDQGIRFALQRAGWASLAVYAPDGSRLRTIGSGQYEAGIHSLRWDGRTAAGRPAPEGVYFMRIESENGIARGRTVLIR